jgi:hypothetical protein
MKPRKPTKFSLFSSLPKEIQLIIIGFALQNVGELIPVQRTPKIQTARLRGLGAPPHRFPSVSRIFREETQRLRPKAFAMVDIEKMEAEESSDDNGEGIDGGKEKIIAPGRIEFDFSRDLLAQRQQMFGMFEPDETVAILPFDFYLWRRFPDLQKLETVVISWRPGCDYGAALAVTLHLRFVQSIKVVVLIHPSDLEQSLELSRYTSVGHIPEEIWL